MAFDMFLKLTGIAGESTNASHVDEIDIDSLTWGILGAPGPGGPPGISNIVVHKLVDLASPLLLEHSVTGAVIPSGTVTFHKVGVAPGGATVDFLVFKLTNVTVTSVGLNANRGDDIPSENVALAFKKVEFDYTAQTASGAAGTKKTFSFG